MNLSVSIPKTKTVVSPVVEGTKEPMKVTHSVQHLAEKCREIVHQVLITISEDFPLLLPDFPFHQQTWECDPQGHRPGSTHLSRSNQSAVKAIWALNSATAGFKSHFSHLPAWTLDLG